MKRFFDVFFSLLMIILLSPLMLIISLVILIVDGKPIIFYQRRVGYNNECFYIYKFRTMKNGTKEDSTAKLKNIDDQLTKPGKVLRKLSLDEIPQFFNVLRGEMSFVGPRPLIPKEKEIRKLREKYNVYSVRPGITGLAQVNGRDNISIEQKALFDKQYVENQSLLLDMKILLKTVVNVIKSKDFNDSCGELTKKYDNENERITVLAVNNFFTNYKNISDIESVQLLDNTINRCGAHLFALSPISEDKINKLKEHFPNFSVAGFGVDGSFELQNPIFFDKERFILENQGTFPLAEKKHERYADFCSWAMLRDLETYNKFVFVNAGTYCHEEKVIQKSLAQILGKIKDLRSTPCIVTGNFDFPEGGKVYNKVVGKSLLRDVKYSCSDFANENLLKKNVKLDYIFINRTFDAKKYIILSDNNTSKHPSGLYAAAVQINFCDTPCI